MKVWREWKGEHRVVLENPLESVLDVLSRDRISLGVEIMAKGGDVSMLDKFEKAMVLNHVVSASNGPLLSSSSSTPSSSSSVTPLSSSARAPPPSLYAATVADDEGGLLTGVRLPREVETGDAATLLNYVIMTAVRKPFLQEVLGHSLDHLTRLCLSAAVSAVKEGYSVLYLDMCNRVDSASVESIIFELFGFKDKTAKEIPANSDLNRRMATVMKNVLVVKCFDSVSARAAIASFRAARALQCPGGVKRPALVVVDSLFELLLPMALSALSESSYSSYSSAGPATMNGSDGSSRSASRSGGGNSSSTSGAVVEMEFFAKSLMLQLKELTEMGTGVLVSNLAASRPFTPGGQVGQQVDDGHPRRRYPLLALDGLFAQRFYLPPPTTAGGAGIVRIG